MIWIYADNITPRLEYICRFIFNERLGTEYKIITHYDSSHQEPAIWYRNNSDNFPVENVIQFNPHGLLDETDIRTQIIVTKEVEGLPVFFLSGGNDLPFDIFAACFYLLSRYEEYLPNIPDGFGRFAHTSSLAYKGNFLHRPIVNLWIERLEMLLKKRFPKIVFNKPDFQYIPTYDIDIAFAYKAKGFIRNWGGFLKNPSMLRLSVLLGNHQDPYDNFEALENWHKGKNIAPVYFFLTPRLRGRFDKNNDIGSKEMRELISRHARKYSLGIHPSWRSNENQNNLREEWTYLNAFCREPIIRSRQHYLKFELPDTFRRLLTLGIRHEYSMGYGSINGFRASVANSFNWYDLKKENETELRIHPFCFMDANSLFEQKSTSEEMALELEYYHDICKAVNGTLITIVHNNFIYKQGHFAAWRESYRAFLSKFNP